MSEDKLSFLSGAPASAESPAPEPAVEAQTSEPAPQAEPQPEGPARGPDGKFVSATPKAEPEPQAAPAATPAAPAAPQPAEPGHVPISALLDEREKRQAIERRIAEYEAKERERAQQQAKPPPDFYEDPDGFQAHQQQLIEQRLYAQNLTISRRFAERQYGAETVAKVHDWVVAKCDADPLFNAQMRSSDDPYEAAMQAFNREQVLAAVKPDDLAAFQAWKAAQAAAGQAPAAIPNQPPVTPPSRSLASATSAGGPSSIPTGPGTAFEAAIPR